MLAICSVSLALLAIGATPALAREYASQITGFTQPLGLTVDSTDDVWVSDIGNNGLITEYDPYPSETKLAEQTGSSAPDWNGYQIRSLAANSANGYLYVADSGYDQVDVFDPANFVSPQWGGFGGGFVYVAADNSGGTSNGRVYVGYTPSSVKVFDAAHNELSFSATESYLSGGEITGTPSGPFGQITNVAVDDHGNIYVVDEDRGSMSSTPAANL